jgi:hypothetical protein
LGPLQDGRKLNLPPSASPTAKRIANPLQKTPSGFCGPAPIRKLSGTNPKTGTQNFSAKKWDFFAFSSSIMNLKETEK